MDPVEPYTYRKCTAFKERMDIVHKLNELIDSWNNGEPGFIERFDEIDTTINEVETELQTQIDEITRDWILCENAIQLQTLFDSVSKKPKTDLIVEIKVDNQIINNIVPKNLALVPFRDVRLVGIVNQSTLEIDNVRMTDDYFRWLTSNGFQLQQERTEMVFPVGVTGVNTFSADYNVMTYDKDLTNNTYRVYY